MDFSETTLSEHSTQNKDKVRLTLVEIFFIYLPHLFYFSNITLFDARRGLEVHRTSSLAAFALRNSMLGDTDTVQTYVVFLFCSQK